MDNEQMSELGFLKGRLTPSEYQGYCMGCAYREMGGRSSRSLKRALGYLDAAIDANDAVELELSRESITVEFHESVHRLQS